jgi:hypothetical protein
VAGLFPMSSRFGPRRGRRGASRVDGVFTRQCRRDGVSATSRHRDAVDATARESTDRVERPRRSAQARSAPRATSARAGHEQLQNYVLQGMCATLLDRANQY